MENKELKYFDYCKMVFMEELRLNSHKKAMNRVLANLNLNLFNNNELENIKADIDDQLKINDNSALIVFFGGISGILILLIIVAVLSCFFPIFNMICGSISALIMFIIDSAICLKKVNDNKKLDQNLSVIRGKINNIILDREKIKKVIDLEETKDKKKAVVTKEYVLRLINAIMARGGMSLGYSDIYNNILREINSDNLSHEKLEKIATLLEPIVEELSTIKDQKVVYKENVSDEIKRILRK